MATRHSSFFALMPRTYRRTGIPASMNFIAKCQHGTIALCTSTGGSISGMTNDLFAVSLLGSRARTKGKPAHLTVVLRLSASTASAVFAPVDSSTSFSFNAFIPRCPRAGYIAYDV